MGSKHEKLDNGRARLEIDIEAAELEKGMQAAYMETGYKYNVPGFRKGKAPRKLIEARFGELVFFDDAFEQLFPVHYDKAVLEHALEPVERPKVEILKMGVGENLLVAAEFTVKPAVKLGQYKGLEAEKHEHPVSDDDVVQEIEKARERAARYVESEGPVKDGDRIMMDYSGKIDDVPFEGGTASNQSLDVGSGRFIPGFEEQIVGMMKGESRTIKVHFPDDYQAEEIKGKEASFDITIHEIKSKQLPEVDDELAKDVSEFETLEELKESIKSQMTAAAERHAKNELEEALIRKATDNAKTEVPDVMVDSQLDYMLRQLEYDLKMRGITLAQYFEYVQTDEEGFKKQNRDEAFNRVKTRLVLETISKAENVEASDEEIAEDIKKHATAVGKEEEEYRKSLSEDDLDYIRDHIVTSKTIDLLTENAKLVQTNETKKERKTSAKTK
jgi:trigger factor